MPSCMHLVSPVSLQVLGPEGEPPRLHKVRGVLVLDVKHLFIHLKGQISCANARRADCDTNCRPIFEHG